MNEREMFVKYGFICHYVFDSDPDSGMINFHTHGLEESFGHIDIQFVLPVDPNILMSITHDIVNRLVKNNKKISNFKNDVIKDFEVEFMVARETGRDVLRILLPDSKGNLPSSPECDPFYKKQIKVKTH